MSFGSVFVLFLFSYQYKHAISFFKEYDPTLNLGWVVLAYLIYFLICHKIKFSKHLAIFSLFALWVLVSYFWASPNDYAFAKSLRFLIYVVPAFWVSTVIIAPSLDNTNNFIASLLTFYVIITSLTLIAYFQDPESLPNLFGTNYLVTGQTIGLGTVILCASQKNKYLIFCGISLFLELHLGGRGPLLSTIIVLGYLGMIRFKVPLWIVLGITISTIAGLWLINCYFTLPLSLHRIFSLDGIESLNLRFEYYQSAWKCLKVHPLIGTGIGGWPAYHGLGNVEWHPHNIFLEIAAETGLIGFVFFICLFVMLIKKVWKCDNKSLICGIAFCFLNALKSGDLNDNIWFFVFAGLILGRKNGSDMLPHSK